jgi:tripartite-type tricarboxylate transporter receptor subunit TctC
LLGAAPAHAQYPNKTIRLIVPFGAGSANDTVGRFVVPALSAALGRPVVIDNRPGAAGNLGAEIAAKSPPDGYTIMMGNISHAISVTLYDRPGYDLVKDFAPVSLLAAGSFLLTLHPSVPAKSVKELIAFAKARPGQLNVATSGSGIFLASGLFQSITGVSMTNVTYKSTPHSVTALVSGEVSVGFPATSAAMSQVRSAKLRGIAVTSERRSPMAPEIPTLAESGVPGYEASPWYGLLVPAGTPAAIVSRLHSESVKALRQPDVKERFGATDMEPIGSAPEQFGAYVRDEIAKWGKVVKATGLRPE